MAHEIALVIAALWLLGWGFTIRDTRPNRIADNVLLFAIWPFASWEMTN